MSPRKALLACGVAAAFFYVLTDTVAAMLYPGYSLRDQAVSELFAIGAPTSPLVVALFSLSSLLLLAFAAGVWLSSSARRALRAMAVLFALSAVNGLALWTLFPMHMRGQARTLTDQMHLILSANPFVILSLVAALIVFTGAFRFYTIATILLVMIPAVLAFQLAPALDADEPTPWLGLLERIAQYGYEIWQVLLAIVLWRKAGAAH